MTYLLQHVYRDATRAALLGLIVNMALGVIKLIGGIVGHSFALISDSVNSLGDSAASIVVLGSLRYAQKPADSDHPYGHTRAEAVGATTVSLMIIVAALLVGWQALMRLTSAHVMPPLWTLWIAGGNVVIKESLFRYQLAVGRKTQSAAMVANAWDHRADAFCSLAALVGIGVVRWMGEQFIWADQAAALIIVGVILITGIRLYAMSASELLDLQADESLVEEVRRAAEKVDGVRGVEKLFVRKTGLEYFVDIHVEVDESMTVRDGHELGHDVKSALLADFSRLRGVLVHLEPHDGDT